MRQSFRDFEYIIIGGDSTDKTNDVIKKYAKSLKKFIIEKDDGIYHAMNKALPFCKGQYYQFLNAGDTLTTNYILDKLNTTIKSDTDLFCGSINTVDDKGKKQFNHYQNVNNPLEQMFCYHPATIARDYVFKKFQFDTKSFNFFIFFSNFTHF